MDNATNKNNFKDKKNIGIYASTLKSEKPNYPNAKSKTIYKFLYKLIPRCIQRYNINNKRKKIEDKIKERK